MVAGGGQHIGDGDGQPGPAVLLPSFPNEKGHGEADEAEQGKKAEFQRGETATAEGGR